MIYLYLSGAALFWVGLGLIAAAPGMVGGDSPELTAAAFHLGSAHAPGYPLFILLGHLFQLLPVGSIAFRMTFFSILTQAAAFLVLNSALNDLPSPSFPAKEGRGRGTLSFLIASLVFAGPLVFHQMVSPEVFALHLLFAAILLRFVLFPTPSNFLLAGFLTGAALSHQHLTLLILPALGWAYRSHFKNTKRLAFAFALFVLGLSPYLVLTLRAVQAPLVNWGNPTSFHQLIYHVTRAQYGGDISKGTPLNGVWDFYLYAKDLLLESFGLGLTLLLLGLWRGWKNFKAEYYIGGFCLFVLLPFLIRGSYDPENNHVNESFLPPAILWFSPLALKGLEWLYGKTDGAKKLMEGIFLILVITLAGFSFIRDDSSRNFAVDDIGRNILLQMPARSVLFSEGDAVTFPLTYLNLVLKLRPDLAIFDRTGGLFKDLYQLLDYRKAPGIQPIQQILVEKNYGQTQRPTAVFYSENTDVPGRTLTMTGLLFQVTEEKKELPPEAMEWDLFRIPRISANHDYFSRETASRYYLFKAPYELDLQKNESQGAEDLRMGKELGFDNSRLLLNAGVVENTHGWTDQAALTFEKASVVTPNFYLTWYNRGVVAEKQNHYTQAVVLFERAAKLAPEYTEAHQHLGFLYFDSRRFEEAVQEWETVKKLDPLYAGAYRNLGYAFMEQKPDYAAHMFRQYLILAPNAPDKATIVKWLTPISEKR